MDRPSIYEICANESYYLIDRPKTPVIYPFTSYQICDIPVIIGDLTITCGGLYIMWIEYTDIIGGAIALYCTWMCMVPFSTCFRYSQCFLRSLESLCVGSVVWGPI